MKILICATFPPLAAGGGGFLFHQLIKGIPRADLSWWSAAGAVTSDGLQEVGTYSSGALPPKAEPQVRWTGVKARFLEAAWIPFAAIRLERFIRQQQPDVIWLLPFMWAIPVLYRVVPKVEIPWHLSLHDFTDTAGCVGRLGLRRAQEFHRMTTELYAHAQSRDVISPAMDAEMERVSGRKANAIIRCGVEPEDISRIRQKDFSAMPPVIRIGYAGTIIVEETFAIFVKAMQQIRNSLGRPVEIHLFGAHDYRNRPWFDETLFVTHGYLSETELELRFRECTWGLAIMEMTDQDPRYNRFSFPCKFSASLAAGLPVICLGNSNSPLIQFATKFRLGPVINEMDGSEIANKLQIALSDHTQFPMYQTEILRCAETELSAAENRRVLHRLIGGTETN